MFSTIVLATVFGGVLVAEILLWGCFLRLGLYWAKVPEVTIGKLGLVAGIIFGARLIASLSMLLVTGASSEVLLLLAGLQLATGIVIPWLAISRVFATNMSATIRAWLPTLLPLVPTVLFALVFIRPFVFEAFQCPTNGMAPTLTGPHWEARCVQCGETTVCTPMPPGFDESPTMICTSFHVTTPSNVAIETHPGDRFLVAKFLKPQRWDVVVFRFPGNPKMLYVKRLIGLPGEEIVIRDGRVFADGQLLTPPESLGDIQYLASVPPGFPPLAGSPQSPAKLGEGEYYVLGDFSPQSKDSRYWQSGAAGHPAYAVPESHFVGVVTHIYWPLKRWRVLR